MRKIDLFWQSNPDWWEFRNHIPTVKEDAPQAAQESYAHYLEQTTEREKTSIAPNWQECSAPHILERGRGYYESGNVACMDCIVKTVPQPEAPKIQKRLVRFINNIPCFLCEGEWVAFPKRHFVYYDFIEETEAYKKAEPIIEELLKKKLGNRYGKLGSCHLDWYQRKQLLMEHCGIEWFTPVELNPCVKFD